MRSISSITGVILMIWALQLFSSCAYRLGRLADTEGRMHSVRFYKDIEKGETYRARMSFKHGYSPRSYTSYKPSEQDSAQGYQVFKYDSTRIYVVDSLDAYMPLFGSGVISPRTFYCNMNDNCQPPDRSCGWSLESGEHHIPDFLGWKGHALIISKIEQLRIPSKKTSRRFMLYSSIPCQYGHTMYLIELTNAEVDPKTDLATFCKTAELTFLEYYALQV